MKESGHILGTGLGLSIVDQVARTHGGRATVESTVGQGSTFKLWVPAGNSVLLFSNPDARPTPSAAP